MKPKDAGFYMCSDRHLTSTSQLRVNCEFTQISPVVQVTVIVYSSLPLIRIVARLEIHLACNTHSRSSVPLGGISVFVSFPLGFSSINPRVHTMTNPTADKI